MIIYLQTIVDPADRSKFERVYLNYRAFMFKFPICTVSITVVE